MDSNMIENKITPNREDGPSFIYPNGTQEWYLNGQLHRENGPAVIYASGDEEWYLNGIEFKTQDKFNINTQFSIKNGF